jgi:hypothetical protein
MAPQLAIEVFQGGSRQTDVYQSSHLGVQKKHQKAIKKVTVYLTFENFFLSRFPFGWSAPSRTFPCVSPWALCRRGGAGKLIECVLSMTLIECVLSMTLIECVL